MAESSTERPREALPTRAEKRQTRDLLREAFDMPLASMDALIRTLTPESENGWAVHKVGFPLCERPPGPDFHDVEDTVLVDELAVLWAGPPPGHWRAFMVGEKGRRTVCSPIVQRLVSELLERGWSYRRIGQMVGAGHTTVRSWHTRTSRAARQVAAYRVGTDQRDLGGERRRQRLATLLARPDEHDQEDIALSVLRFLEREYPVTDRVVLCQALRTVARALTNLTRIANARERAAARDGEAPR